MGEKPGTFIRTDRMEIQLRNIIFFLLLFIFLGDNQGQNGNSPQGLWHHNSLSGEVKVKGLYREQKSLFNDIGDDQQSIYYIGGLRLHSSSYFWNPDIILLDIEGEVNPESRGEKYLAVPDRSEVRTLNKLGIKTTVFNNKAISLSSYINLHQSYFNRELLTDVRSNNRQWGGILSSNNKFLPVSLTFRQTKWDQEELQSGRKFKMDQNYLEGRVSKSFGKTDKHELIYGRDEYKYLYADLNEVYNIVDRISLSDNIYFDSEKNYNFSSLISYYNQEGDNEFKKIESSQRILFRLPQNFRLSSSYNFYNREDPFQKTIQNKINGGLQHKLYLSLITNLFADYSRLNRTSGFDSYETNFKTGIEFNYTKKIPLGQLNLSYRYFRHHQSAASESSIIQIRSEKHVLSDSEIVLLDRPYIDPATVFVKDETGTIVFQPGFDYLLIERNNFYEIQRVPGGLIINNQSVYIDYMATPPDSYEYDADNKTFTASILLFKRILEIYYRNSEQDYTNLTDTDFLTLNYYNQNVIGSRIDLGFTRFGIELDEYKSNIIPYKMMRYFLDVNGRIGKKLLISLNGNIRDYIIIDNETKRLYANISGRVAYNIRPRTKVNLDFGYLNQTGRNIELEALTARAEFISNFRQITLKAGFELYQRLYINSDYKLKGAYLQIARKF